MKKIIVITIGLCFSFSGYSQSNTVKNGGFENWDLEVISETLDDWLTSADETPGSTAISKESDAVDGSYSLRLQTIMEDGDTTFGFALLGDFGDFGPSEHIYYPYQADSLTGWIKYEMQGNDSLTILVSQRTGITPPQMEVVKLAGSQGTWTRFAIPLPALTQDSILLAFASGNAFASFSVPGSYVMLDNIGFTSAIGGTPPNIPNHSFENWTENVLLNPQDWYSLNPYFPAGSNLPVKRTMDANSGSYAITLETLEAFGDVVPGILTNGEFVPGNDPATVPYTANPTNFKTFYKYSPVGLDTAYVMVAFYSNEVLVGQQVMVIDQLTPSYLENNITLPAMATPDAMSIIAMSGNNPGSKLWLDDIELTGGNVGVDEWNVQAELFAYPNPAKDLVQLQLNSHQSDMWNIRVIDMMGREVYHSSHSTSLGSNTFSLDLSHLPSGNYIVSAQGKVKVLTQQISLR